MRSYDAARSLFSLLTVLAWIVIGVGALAALGLGAKASEMSRWNGGSSGGAFLMGMLPGLAMSFVGFLGLVFAQVGRAGVDTAECSQQMLQLSRDHLEVSKQSLRQGEAVRLGFEALAVKQAVAPSASYADRAAMTGSEVNKTDAFSAEKTPAKIIEYKGKDVQAIENGYRFAGMEFPSLEAAQRYIDQLGVNPFVELSPKS